MGKKGKQKPGVRTKLNSGDKKVKKYSKTDKHAENTPNPTAVAASKKLPEMKLSHETNWVAETSSTIMLNSEGVLSSERSGMPETITYMPVELPQNIDLPAEIKDDIKQKIKANKDANKKNNAEAAKVLHQPKPKKNKFKDKFNGENIIDNLKTYISNGISESKIDYARLNKIQAELNGKITHVTSKLTDKMETVMDTASTVVSTGGEQLDKIRLALQANIEEAKQSKAAEKSAKAEETKKTKQPALQPETAKTIIPEKDVENPELTQAIQSEKSAQAALEALKEQLSSADDAMKQELQDKIAKKQKQLEAAQEKIKTYKLDLNG